MSTVHRLAASILVVLACSTLGADAAHATLSVLVDEIHGFRCRDQLAALWPDCELTALTAADYPMEMILASGVVSEDTEIQFTVPPGTVALYVRFQVPAGTSQYPFISLYGPSGGFVGDHCLGHLHVESPSAGNYTLAYASWEQDPTPYEIGIGPHVLTAGRLAEYDVVLRLYDNTGFLLIGNMPSYSAREFDLLAAHVAAGRGNLLVREPEVEIAVKPIIDLTAPVDLACDLTVALPGVLTFAVPDAATAPVPGGEAATWRNLAVAPGATTRVLYEGALSPPHRMLQVSGSADTGLRLRNHGLEPLLETHLARRVGDDRWQLVSAGDLRPGPTVAAPAGEVLARGEVVRRLENVLAAGGRLAGLAPDQLAEFQGRYRWIDRLLDAADGTGCWTAIYRVGEAACDAILPLVTTPAAADRARTLWFWLTNIPDGLPDDMVWPAQPPTPVLAGTGAASSPLQLVEYGFIRQRYPVTPEAPAASAAKDQYWLDWYFHDEVWLLDPVDNAGWPEVPWLPTIGAHPAAAALTAGLGPLGGVRVGAVWASEAERILGGGPDAYTDDGFFWPGDLPPVVVATGLGDGRFAAIASRELVFSALPANRTFVKRLLQWTASGVTAAPDDLPAARIARLDARPNPFNPRTEILLVLTAPGPVRVTVYDLAGREVAELLRAHVGAGEQRLAWDGRDRQGRPAATGVYLVRVNAGGEVAGRKVTLVE